MTLSSNVNDLASRIATEFNTLRSEGSVPVIISETPPTTVDGKLWFNSATAVLYLKVDGTWVAATPAVEGPTGPTGPAGIPGVVAQTSAPSNTEVLWLDTDDTADILELREVYPHPFMLAFS